MGLRRALAILILMVATVTAVVGYYGLSFWLQSPSKRLEISWKKDLDLLADQKKLPTHWAQIQNVHIESDNPLVYQWLEEIPHPIQVNRAGTYKLDILILHWMDGHEYGVVVQYDLIDKKTNNTIWELGRTFRLGFIL